MADTLPKFEIPESIRAFTEKAVDDFLAATHGAIEKAQTASTGTQASVAELHKTVIDLAEENIAATFDHAQQLTKAKTVQEIVELQNAFLKTRLAALGEQSRVVAETAQKTATTIAETVKPA